MIDSRIESLSLQASDLSLKNHLCISVYQAANKIARLYGSLLAPHNLTFPQYQVLIVLWDHGASTIGAICSSLALDTSTITPVVKRLEALGYVNRCRDRIDERKVYVSLTERGLHFKEEAQALRCQLIHDLNLKHEEFREAQRFHQMLSRLLDRMLDRQTCKRLAR